MNDEIHFDFSGKVTSADFKDLIHSKEKISESNKNITKENFRDHKSKFLNYNFFY